MHFGNIARSPWALRAGLAIVALATSATPALAQPGVPRTYDVTAVESTNPIPGGGGNFGWGITSADLTGDGKMELLVAQSQDNVPGEIFIYDGATSRFIHSITPPESNNVPVGPGANAGNPVPAPALAFVYVEHMADIGGCPQGDTDGDRICGVAGDGGNRVGAQDGIPEIIAGSRSLRVDADSPRDGDRDSTDFTFGRGYVFDGKSLAQGRTVVMKRIDMPVAHRQAQKQRFAPFINPQPPSPPGPTPPAGTQNGSIGMNFGRVMMSPQGLPPCSGPASEANNAGVGPCEDMPPAVRIGDVDGLANNPATAANARGDIVVGVRGYRETTTTGLVNSATAGSQCATLTGTAAIGPTSTSGNCTSGKAFVYRGEDIANSSPYEILDGTPNGNLANGSSNPTENVTPLANPRPQTSSSDVFGNLQRIGDVGCIAPSPPAGTAPDPNLCGGNPGTNFFQDGKPEIIGTDAFVDYPMQSPDSTGFPDIGASYVYDLSSPAAVPANGVQPRAIYEHPEPESRSAFSHNFSSGWPAGNLGHSGLPDFLTGAPAQNVKYVGEGRAFVWNGEATSGRGRLIGVLDDPTPAPAGNWGSAYTGVGNLVGGQLNPANEVMVGSYAPFLTSTEAAQLLINDVAIYNAANARLIQRIPDPAQERGSGFGVGITPMGDLNEDGFLDFSVSAYLSNIPGQPADGRAYIFRSNNSPAPPAPARPGATVSTPKLLRPGRCANDTVGTARSDSLKGTTAGDRMFGFGGDDRVEGFADDDCLEGGTGEDRMLGAAGADRLIGGRGVDRMLGGNDRDRLFGGSSGDRVKGGYGGDLVAGGSGNDRLDGGPETDRVYGERGNDRIRAGGGRNILDGGTSNDNIFARNHRRDVLRGGTGRDWVSADRTDVVQVDCERTRRAGR